MVNKKTVYIAKDGSQFKTEYEAIEHEKWAPVLGAFEHFLSWYGCHKTPLVCDLKQWVREHRTVFETILDNLDD